MRIYYGWFIVAIGVIALTLTMGSTYVSFGLFVRPVSEEFHLSRANINTALIILSIGSAIFAPFVGRQLDRIPPQRIMAIGAVALGASFLTLAFSHDVRLSAVVIAIPLAIGCLASALLTSTTLAARWFTVYRGRALAITAIGLSLGGVVISPLISMLIESVGWRTTLMVMAFAVSGALLALVPFVRARPGPSDVEVREATAASQAGHVPAHAPDQAGPLLKAPQLLRMGQFWSIGLSTGFVLGTMQTFAITIVPLAQESGLGAAKAASLLSILSASAVAGKLTLAGVADRVDRILLMTGLFIVLSLMNVALLLYHDYYPLIVCCVLVGLAIGAISPSFHALVADHFGAASFGTALGLATPLLTILSAVCVRYAGEVFDRTGSYNLMFISFGVVQLACAALMLTTRLFARPVALVQA